MKKILKGNYGYLTYEKKITLIKTIFMYVLAIGIFLLGLYTMHTNKNIWSIIAVLSILPASKSAVRLIMLLRYKSLDKNLFNRIENNKGNINVLYELIITTSEKSYYVDAAAYYCGSLILLSHIDNKSIKKLSEHLNNTFGNNGIKSIIKIYDNDDKYIDRLIEMNINLNSENNSFDTEVESLLRVLAL